MRRFTRLRDSRRSGMGDPTRLLIAYDGGVLRHFGKRNSMTRFDLSLAVVLATSVCAAAQRTPDIRLDTDGPGAWNSNSPEIAAVGSNVYVAWADTRNSLLGTRFDMYCNASTDGGATWLTQDVRVNAGLPGLLSDTPRLAVSDAAVYVTWSDNRYSPNRDIRFNRSTDHGLTWQPLDARLDRIVSGESVDPQIASADSNVYVVWEDSRNGSFGWDIYLNYSNDHGQTWQTSDIRLDTDAPGSAHSHDPQIVANGSSVYVTWYDNRNGQQRVFVNYSTDGGATWQASDIPVSTASFAAVPQVAVSGSSVYVVWYGDGIWLNYSSDGGVTWQSSPIRIDSSSADTYLPKVAASGSSVYVSWTDRRNGRNDLYFNRSSDGGGTWQTSDTQLAVVSKLFNQQRLASTGNSVYVTWSDDPNGEHDVFLNHSQDGGATWLSAPIQLQTDGPGASFGGEPAIATTDDTALITWHDYRDGKLDIRFNIPFGALPYGAGHAGAGGAVPSLAITGAATVGNTTSIDTSNGLGNANGIVLIGAGPASQIATPLFGGTLLVLPFTSIPVTLGATGANSLPLTIPNDAALMGENYNFQGLLLDPGASDGISMSNAVELWIG